jgi:hypothetical protein
MKLGRSALWALLSVCCAVATGLAQPMDCINPDVIIVTSSADTILVDHMNATKNCCSTLTVDVTSEDFVVDFVEGDAGDFCTCVCCFNLNYDANGFAAGHYLVRVWYLGELIGQGEVDVAGSGEDLALGAVASGPTSRTDCRS